MIGHGTGHCGKTCIGSPQRMASRVLCTLTRIRALRNVASVPATRTSSMDCAGRCPHDPDPPPPFPPSTPRNEHPISITFTHLHSCSLSLNQHRACFARGTQLDEASSLTSSQRRVISQWLTSTAKAFPLRPVSTSLWARLVPCLTPPLLPSRASTGCWQR